MKEQALDAKKAFLETLVALLVHNYLKTCHKEAFIE